MCEKEHSFYVIYLEKGIWKQKKKDIPSEKARMN